ncbi:hypothetical protein C8J56DRAFT_1171905 [Mycena floridula]|nr:hypothetical protein C8J56DRAFT_1171905 [Mycena floridula]
MCLDPLPIEISREIFMFLPLKSLIRGMGVSRAWRRELQEPALNILPIRRGLLSLYLSVIEDPTIRLSRDWSEQTLPPLDRENFLSQLISRYNNHGGGDDSLINNVVYQSLPWAQQYQPLVIDDMPTDFVLYIREWPEKAVFADIWPTFKPDVHWKIVLTKVMVNEFRSVGEQPMVPALILWYYHSRHPDSTHLMFLGDVETGSIRINKGEVADRVMPRERMKYPEIIWEKLEPIDITLATSFLQYLLLQLARLQQPKETSIWQIDQMAEIMEQTPPGEEEGPTFYQKWTKQHLGKGTSGVYSHNY